MASPLWGFQAGQQARAQDDREAALASLALARGQQQLEAGNIEIETGNLALQSQKKMLELMQQRNAEQQNSSSNAPPAAGVQELNDIPDQLDDLAKMALESGLPQQASEYASKASTIRSNATLIRERANKQRLQELQLAANLLQTVSDEKSWQQANSLFSMTTGKASPFSGMPYSPELAAKITDSVMSQRERALRDAADARASASIASARANDARVDLIRSQERLAETRTEVLRKAGSLAAQPKAADVQAITDLVLKDYPIALSDARVLARPVAERMLSIMKTDNVSRSVAAQRAFNEAKSQGNFGGLMPLQRMSGSLDRPLDMPKDTAKLRKNMYYIGKGKYEGQTLLWTGTGFMLAQPGGAGTGIGEEDEEAAAAAAEEGFDNEHTPDVDEGQ